MMKKRTINNTRNGLIILGIIILSVYLSSSFVLAGQQQGGDVIKFDIQPRSISATNPKVTATIGIKIYPNEFISYCKNKPNVSYGLFLDAPGVGDRAAVSWTVVPTPNQIFEKEISVPLTSVNAGGWYVLLYCGPALGTANDIWLSGGQMSKSENIDVQVYSQSDFTFGCVAPNGIYDCDSNASATCSNMNNRCNGKCTKIQPKSLCSKPATTIVMGCVASDGKYACSNGTASNCSDIPACAGKSCIQINPASLCGSGISATASKSYIFNITNPLKGGPNDLFDIINIVTQWIMYISIPLAVLYIMYAGFLMLTAGPTPANFQKGRDILKYVVLGLAIIFIGKGFVSLIISVIELGGTTSTESSSPPLGAPAGTNCVNSLCENTGLKCVNFADCQPVVGIGEPCTTNSECASGQTCNQICQRKDGNGLGEACQKSANPSNCKSTACNTIGTNESGTCVENPTGGGSSSSGQQYQNVLTVQEKITAGGYVGRLYDVNISVLNPVDPSLTFNWQMVEGALPPGTVLESATTATEGRIHGTPTKIGTYKVTIQAMDIANKQYGRKELGLIIWELK